MTLLTGSVGAAARRSALSDVFTGDAGIVIGTHALLEEQVQFSDLGLVVIDEQHRFGVEQRDALRAKAADNRPHVLVMTATPIPRTVAMTVYGDLETSTLTELPAGRSAIATHVVPAADKPRYLERAWERVREEVARGRQASWCARGSATAPIPTTIPAKATRQRGHGGPIPAASARPAGASRWRSSTWPRGMAPSMSTLPKSPSPGSSSESVPSPMAGHTTWPWPAGGGDGGVVEEVVVVVYVWFLRSAYC